MAEKAVVAVRMVVSDPKTGKSYQREVPKEKESSLVGKKIGEKIEGGIIGLAGYSLQITGGSDNTGFPMRPEIQGSKRVKAILGGGPGVKNLRKGEKRKKLVGGSTVSPITVQVNCKIAEAGPQKLEELGFVDKPKEKKA